MNFKFNFFFISFVLAGSRFSNPPSTIIATFNEKIASGDINALQSLLNSNSKFIKSSAAMSHINNGLITAIHSGHTSVVQLMLKNEKINAAIHDNIAIRLASANGEVDIVKSLLARSDVNPGAKGNEALINAAKSGHTEVVRLLLDHPNVKSSARNYKAVTMASQMNYPDIVKLLVLDGRFIPASVSFNILERAAHFEDVDLVRFLMGYPSFSDSIVLLLIGDDLLAIKTLVEAGYTFNEDTLDRTLRYASNHGNDDIAEYLESLKDKPKLPERPLITMTEQCSICLADENLLEGYMTSCNHQFHAECLQQWISKHNSCPICRSSII